jgi:hypothetical protein
MRVVYAPESPQAWEAIFLSKSIVPNGQRGGRLPGYGGNPYQRGAGIGSFFRGLFRAAVPLLKRAAKAVGKEALRTGVGVLGDVARGGEFLPSLETHGREAVSNLADKAKDYLATTNQTGGSRGRRRRDTGRKKARKPKQKRRQAVKRTGGKRRKPIKARKTKRRKSAGGGGDIFDNV